MPQLQHCGKQCASFTRTGEAHSVEFAASARRIRLTTIGLFQYFTPSTYLVLAVWLFGEQFTTSEWITFGLLWTGLFLYTSEVWRTRQV